MYVLLSELNSWSRTCSVPLYTATIYSCLPTVYTPIPMPVYPLPFFHFIIYNNTLLLLLICGEPSNVRQLAAPH